jgi:hydroxyethylthiazole kinase-like sugar kinase family protein
MSKSRIAFVILVVAGLMTSTAQAGCIKGAVVGDVAGHLAHHHAVIGAIAGCAIGHHMAVERKKKEREQARLQQQNHDGH